MIRIRPWEDCRGRWRALPSRRVRSPFALAQDDRLRQSLRIDGAIALLLLGLGEFLLFTGGIGEPDPGTRGPDVLSVGLVALVTLPLAVRRLLPVGVFVVSTAAAGTLNVLEYPGELMVVPAVAVYTLAAVPDPGRRRRAAIAITGFAALTSASILGGETNVGAGFISLALYWGAAWYVGRLSRFRREYLAALEERARWADREAEQERRLAAAEERARFARELHDSAGHAINAILLQLQAARVLRDRDPERAEAALDTIERVARETIGEIDRLVGAVREEGPAQVSPLPGVDAIEALVEQHRIAGLGVNVEVRGHRRPVPRAVDRAAYRIVQEALTNATRYGEGRAEVLLDYDNGALELTVENPVEAGASAREGGGHGITGMRERATLLGGTLETGTERGVFRVHARLPYRQVGR
jgi:signal transduction histidine kinase